mmetsp:Transcript_3303/g.10357  ORF Transcript_3303/g.10357 Transcript_3303/m.10357 type:complete len:360 (+) Transcript_3303:363-1442(+)
MRHLRREHHGSALALDAKLVLEVAQEVAKVNVEVLARLFHHDVVVVPVADAHHVRRHAVAGSAAEEHVHRLAKVLLVRVVVPDPVHKRALLVRAQLASVSLVDLCCRHAVCHDLKQPAIVPGGQALVWRQAQVECRGAPHLVHHGDQLQRHRILPQVVARLEHDQHRWRVGVGVLKHQPQWQLGGRHHLALLHDQLAHLHAGVQRQPQRDVQVRVQLGQLSVQRLLQHLLALLLVRDHRARNLGEHAVLGPHELLLQQQVPLCVRAQREVRPHELLVPRRKLHVLQLHHARPEQRHADQQRLHQGALHQEAGQRRVQARLVLERLRQLNQELGHQAVRQVAQHFHRVRPHRGVREVLIQ